MRERQPSGPKRLEKFLLAKSTRSREKFSLAKRTRSTEKFSLAKKTEETEKTGYVGVGFLGNLGAG